MIEEGIQTTISMVTALSADAVVLTFAVLLCMAAGALGGRREELALAFASYPTFGLLIARPSWAPIESPWATLAIFCGAYALSFFVLRRFIAGMFPFTTLHKYVEMTALGVAGAGAFIAVAAATNAFDPLYQLSSTTAWIFESPWSLLLWLLTPLLAASIFVRRY